ALMFAFRASVSGLVPLFAIGAFLTFTLSQAGMAVHWWRKRGRRWQARLAVNGVGAIATALVLIIEVVGNFTEGAWIVLVVIPAVVVGLHAAGAHIQRARRAVAVGSKHPRLAEPRHHHILIPVNELNKAVVNAVSYTL